MGMRHTLSYTRAMSAIHTTRIERLKRLEHLLPREVSSVESCPDGARLLGILGEADGAQKDTARLRKLQRDLDELVTDGRIEAVNPGGKPLRYRRLTDDLNDDPPVLQYALEQVRDLIAEYVPMRQLDRFWQRVLTEVEGPVLDRTRLRIVPDTLRLHPVELHPKVLSAAIEALAKGRALDITYRNAEDLCAPVRIHPQALLQRGPIPYLFALKNDEDAPVRLYALHRMVRAEVLTETPARAAAGFDLDQAIARGQADFGQGELIDLELRVRGYLATVLAACPLAPGQWFEDEPEGSEFDLRVSARVPSTGQLLRWLLGAGDNLEVVSPPELRHVVAVQAGKMAAIYSEMSEERDEV
ncbi:MAG: WYL domain-containing protein [Sphingobacteriia bacterium]|nr:WYL domain-containing protein [Sphingobacteriia bacterium]